MESKKRKNRPMPFDEMSTTGAMTSDAAVTRSLRPVARPERQGAGTEGPNPVTSSLRPMARPPRKPTADQQELIDYVERLERQVLQEQKGAEAYVGPRPMEINERTPIGKPLTMGERMRMQEVQQERASGGSGHQGRPAKKFKDGGKVKGKGFPDLNKDGKITKADILKGRGVEGFADGGMVRGVKPGQTSGTKFSGTF